MTGPRYYILHPGFVRSRADGDRHFISAADLRRLYAVPPDARCLVASDSGRLPLGTYSSACDVHLYPRSDGRYQPVGGGAAAGPAWGDLRQAADAQGR